MQKVKNLLSNFNETRIKMGLTRFDRIEKYLKTVERHKLKGKKDIEIAREIRELINYRLKKVRRLYYLNLFFYLGIYFSVLSIIFPNFIIVSSLINLIGDILGIIGTTVFIIGIFIIGKISELYYQDLNLLTSHYISIYARNDAKSSISTAYHEFVQFFKTKLE